MRYKPAGWTRNGAEAPREVVVNAPLRCAGLWRKEVQVAVEAYLDGSFMERREFWVAQSDILKLSPPCSCPKLICLRRLNSPGERASPEPPATVFC